MRYTPLSTFGEFMRRSASGWSSLLTFNQLPVPKKRRAKHYNFPISPRRKLDISLRRFRTAKAKRSKQYKQLVLPIYGLSTRELAVRVQHSRAKKRVIKKSGAPQLRWATYGLVVVGLAGMVYSAVLFKSNPSLETPTTYDFSAQSVPKSRQPVVLARAEPSRIKIDKIGVNVDIISLGQTADGAMETPGLFDYVTGWYRYSPTPGERGPAVIVGHIDNYKSKSVFYRLGQLAAGDVVEVTRVDGTVASFRVDALQQFDKTTFPTQQVYGNTTTASLRLITCGGTFDRKAQDYTANMVVFATMIEPPKDQKLENLQNNMLTALKSTQQAGVLSQTGLN